MCLPRLTVFTFHSLKKLVNLSSGSLIDNGSMILLERYFHLPVYILRAILLYPGTNFLSVTIQINVQVGIV